jgi:glycerol uptake facilitator protein
MLESVLYECIGTAILLLLGSGVVANVLLDHSKGKGGGWIVISFAWAMAVFVGVYVSAPYSGAHLNPAVTVALAVLGKFSWDLVGWYVLAQVVGAGIGSFLAWLVYKKHFDEPGNGGLKMAVFCTSPAIRHPFWNLISEFLGTFMLIIGVLYIIGPEQKLGALEALPVAFLVLAIGLSLGGPTGYAINPARDFGPRLVHALLPIPDKQSSDWGYAWIPVVGPLLGAVAAALFYGAIT